MATSRSSRVTRSSVGLNGLDENFCGRTLRNRSIAQPEEVQGSPLPGSRAPRSPKKRQDAQAGSSEKPGGHQGKVTHHKASSVDRETWPSPRKRGLSCSESDGCGGLDQAENCEGRGKETSGAVGRDASPLLKKAKRCFRSGESHGSKDDLPSAPPMPVIPASPCAPLTTVKENSEGGDLLRHNSTADSPSSSSPDLNKEEGEEEEEEEEEDDGHVQQLLNSNSHKSCIGLGQTSSSPDAQTNSLCLSAASNTTCPGPGPALLNGSQRGTPCPSPPDPIVPCRNYDPGQEEGKDSDPGQEEGKDSDPGQEEEGKDSDPGQEEGGKDSDPGMEEEGEDSDPGMEEGGKDSDPGMEEGGEDSDPGMEEEGEDSDPGMEEEGEDSDPGMEEEGEDSDPGQEEEGEDSDPGQEEEGEDSGECPAPLLASFEEDSSTPHLSVREEEVDVVGYSVCREEVVTATEEEVEVTPTEEEESCGGGINGWSFTPLVVQNTVATSIIINNNIINNVNNNNSGEFTMPLLAPPTRSDPPCTPSISSTSPPSFTEPHEHRYTLRTSPRRAACGGGKAVAPCSSPRDPLRERVEAGRELVATPTLSSCSSIQAREGSLLSPPSVPMEQGNSGARRDTVGWDSMGHGELCETRGGLEEVPGGGSQQEDDPDVYYFESDHLTLKHNKDYQRLLQTVGVLEAQRTQSIRDLERLARQQREALRDPVSFVEQLQKQVELDLPHPQRVVQLPDVSWDQYTSGLGDFEREFCDKKRTTRRLKLIFDKVRLPDGPKSPLDPKKEEGEPSTLYSALPSSDALENSNNSQRIRGRLCYQSKPDTFNQLWTVEEQKKLEHLLLQFSPEVVESKRWQKIADALGNRTAKQVASRVQKYFIKLTKAGISVPGRTPNMCIYSKKVSNKRQHHLNKHLYRPSTFLTSYEPPVFMEEEDERAAYYSSLQDPDGDDTDEECVPVELRHLPEYKELLELKRMKKHKLQEIQAESSMALHHGYKCDVCGVEPIQGVRWHCQDCPSDNAVDFCSNCSGCLYKTESHLPSHHLEPVHHHETFLDRDYCLAQTPGHNYLDPNYYPANR